MIQIKTPDEIALMREAGLITQRALAAMRAAVRPGITTGELDRIAGDSIRSEGAVPSFLGYRGWPYPEVDHTSFHTPSLRIDAVKQFATRADGTGLGLTITRKIINQHGGRLLVDTIPGRGTTMFFTVPLSEAASPGTEGT